MAHVLTRNTFCDDTEVYRKLSSKAIYYNESNLTSLIQGKLPPQKQAQISYSLSHSLETQAPPNINQYFVNVNIEICRTTSM